MPAFARVSVNIPQLTGLFDYEIPPSLDDHVVPGSLVTVPFGRQVVQGLVVALLAEPSVPETRQIETLVDEEPVLTPWQMHLAEAMAHENLATLSQCYDLMVPPGLSQHADVMLELHPAEIPGDLSPVQKRLLDLLKRRGSLTGRQVDVALPRTAWRESLPGLVKRGLLTSFSILPPPSVRPKVVRTAQFNAPANWRGDPSVNLGRTGTDAAARRQSVLEFLEEKAIPINVAWVYAASGATSADLNYLAEKDLIRLGETEVWRDPLEKLQPVLTQAPILTTDQADAWQRIAPQLSGNAPRLPNLLVGVTGSGKTEIYLRAAAEMLAAGRGTIILVPEISLTPQTVKRFFARFPGKVGLIHSKLSAGERYDTWRRIRAGSLPIVVGPRSALFSPLPDPGLVIVDEAHDPSYRQEEIHPFYHAIDIAILMTRITASCLVLGSATPGIETLFRFDQEKWNIHKLPNRILGHGTGSEASKPVYTDLPPVQIVDMREELKAGNRSALSRELKNELEHVLERREQAILFLNRRGSASYVFCRDCGYVLRCPRCDTQLTWHADTGTLVCHICNYHRAMPAACPSCGGKNIRQFGMGTESLEKLVAEHFPAARILRWDADSVRYKGAHDLILDHFLQHRADILIGTQMLAKGLDLPLVTLVGVVLADISLNLPDFRAAERTFQLLTQVAGRAGRSQLGGKVLLQTFQPDHYAVRAAAAHDLDGFYRAELSYREKTGYPPFSRLLKIELRHSDSMVTQKAALTAGNQIQSWLESGKYRNASLIGPVPCFYQKRVGYYRWQVIIRAPDPRVILEDHPLCELDQPGLLVDLTLDPQNLL